MRTYLDHNATVPMRPEVIALMTDVMQHPGNPSSVHKAGRDARSTVEVARRKVAALVNALPTEVIFTSGGTEANDLAINGLAANGAVDEMVISGVEHPAVLESAKASGLHVTTLRTISDGVVDLAHAAEVFDRLAAEGKSALTCVMLANNETGVIQPIQKLGQMIRERKAGLLHCDAVQGAGKIPVDIVMLGADMMALSSHKIGGPQGVGALVCREGVALAPRINGGGQELGRRSGTENVAGIAGFGAAAEAAMASLDQSKTLQAWRDEFESALKLATNNVHVFGENADRLPNTSCFATPGVRAETALMAMDLAGFEISAGSACASGKVGKTTVLAAMGADDEEQASALRVSLGWNSGAEDLTQFLSAWTAHVAKVKGQS